MKYMTHKPFWGSFRPQGTGQRRRLSPGMRPGTRESATKIFSDVYFIDYASIPPIAMPRKQEAPKKAESGKPRAKVWRVKKQESHETSEKPLTVEMMSGRAVEIKVPAPYLCVIVVGGGG